MASFNSTEQWIAILDERRNSNDVLWLTFHYHFVNQYRYLQNRSPEAIRKHVYQMPFIQALLSSQPSMSPRIDRILDEMSHTFSLRSIRFIGYFLIKIMKRIYENVWVSSELPLSENSIYYTCDYNSNITDAINHLSKQTPILYLPTHRSYADFLLMSYICFHFNLPLPSIAAGIDFLSLNQIASLLRACGAFYIRRSFNNDSLYWNVFRAYVQSQILGGEHPMEFFIEGTRSRSGKSLYPRIGLLSVALELYFTGQIPDLLIIPVSISYDRVLEEGLYARELCPATSSGGKPPETTKHLLSATNAILSQNFGSVYVRFTEPISIRELCGAQDFRLFHTLDSKCQIYSAQKKQEIEFILSLAKLIIKRQQMNFVFSPFSLASLSILSYFNISSNETDISLAVDLIVKDVELLSYLLPYANFSCNLQRKSIKSKLIEEFRVHSNIVKLSEDSLTISLNIVDPIIKIELQQYANQSMQLLIDFACFQYTNANFNKYKILKNFLSREFIYSESDLNESFRNAQILSHVMSDRVISILSNQIQYYINSYLEMTEWLSKQFSSQQSKVNIKALVKTIQNDIMINSDVAQNTIQFLLNINVFTKDVNNYLTINYSNLEIVSNDLKELSNEQSLQTSNYNQLKSNL